MATVSTRILTSIDDLALSPQDWSRLLDTSDSNVVFLTPQWQRAWWKTFGRGQLLLTVAERATRPVAIAPLFCDGGMVFFIGSGGSDYLDFIGHVADVDVLASMLETVRDATSEFLGFRFYHVPDASRTGSLLQEAAILLDMDCFDEGHLTAPALELKSDPQAAMATTGRKSLLRHERFFVREGELTVRHFREAALIQSQLSEFFTQHIARWEGTSSPSMFLHAQQRSFFEEITAAAWDTDWLRFTRLDWNERPIAFHFGMCYRGNYLWYKPSFAIDLARRSPGEVLLRQLFLAAIAEEAHTFDFGLGDESFKSRFATRINQVRTWGLYPKR